VGYLLGRGAGSKKNAVTGLFRRTLGDGAFTEGSVGAGVPPEINPTELRRATDGQDRVWVRLVAWAAVGDAT